MRRLALEFKLLLLVAAALSANQPGHVRKPAQTRAALQVADAANGTLTGVVVDVTEAPISSAEVTLSSGIIVYGTKLTPADGSFRFNGIPYGIYEINVIAPGFKSRLLQSIRVLGGAVVTVGIVRLDVGQIAGCPTSAPSVPTLSFSRCERCMTALDGTVILAHNVPGTSVACSRPEPSRAGDCAHNDRGRRQVHFPWA